MSKNILITGGTGYIGSHAVVRLIEAGNVPIIVDNLSNSSMDSLRGIEQITGIKPKFYNIDLLDKGSLIKVFKSNDIDSVIHFAALKAVGESINDPLNYYQNNITGLLNLLEIMRGFSVNKIVFSSSCTVYGEPDYVPVDENHPIKKSTSPYGQTKIMAENILEDISKAYGLRVVALRYFNPIGAHPSGLIGELPIGRPNNLVPFITQSVAGIMPAVSIFGDDFDTPDGSCIRDFIDVNDLASAHIAAIEKMETLSQPFTAINIGTGVGISVLQLINTFEKATNKKVNYTVSSRREGDIVRIWGNASLAKKILGWKSTISLEESLKSAWKWEQNPKNT